jgi:hypothetical protein
MSSAGHHASITAWLSLLAVRGYGRWVRDVLVWTKAPLMFRNELVAADGLAGEVHPAEPGAVKRIGGDPVILPMSADGGAHIELATASDDRGRALEPLAAAAPPPARPG